MSSDWLFDAVQVEVAYRNEQLRKAARSKWVGRAGRVGRRLRAHRTGGVDRAGAGAARDRGRRGARARTVKAGTP